MPWIYAGWLQLARDPAPAAHRSASQSDPLRQRKGKQPLPALAGHSRSTSGASHLACGASASGAAPDSASTGSRTCSAELQSQPLHPLQHLAKAQLGLSIHHSHFPLYGVVPGKATRRLRAPATRRSGFLGVRSFSGKPRPRKPPPSAGARWFFRGIQ